MVGCGRGGGGWCMYGGSIQCKLEQLWLLVFIQVWLVALIGSGSLLDFSLSDGDGGREHLAVTFF